MISKQDLLKLAKKEFSTTLKVLRAFPVDKNEFKPHERSSDVVKLTSTFVSEMWLLRMLLFAETFDRAQFKTYKPDNVETVTADFEKEANHAISQLESLPDVELSKTVTFAGLSIPADEFLLMIILDQVHHRGQLTVYIRMAGGKVPSIYGPSADDNSTNL
jgi:uncharacterized damage-inducible protein DinB